LTTILALEPRGLNILVLPITPFYIIDRPAKSAIGSFRDFTIKLENVCIINLFFKAYPKAHSKNVFANNLPISMVGTSAWMIVKQNIGLLSFPLLIFVLAYCLGEFGKVTNKIE